MKKKYIERRRDEKCRRWLHEEGIEPDRDYKSISWEELKKELRKDERIAHVLDKIPVEYAKRKKRRSGMKMYQKDLVKGVGRHEWKSGRRF